MFKEFLTVEGERLLTKSVTGSAKITFTKVMLGDGTTDTTSKNIQDLDSPRLTTDIYSVKALDNNQIEIVATLKSNQVIEGFSLKEKGIYATDGENEILFLYGRDSVPDWIENKSDGYLEKTFRTILLLSDEQSATINIQQGMYASENSIEQAKIEIVELSKVEIERAQNEINNNTNSKIDEAKNTLIEIINTVFQGGGSSEELDEITQLITDVYQLIGPTNAAAGSTTAGGVMAKLNTILKRPSGYVNDWNMKFMYNTVKASKSGVFDMITLSGKGVLEWTSGTFKYDTYSIMPSVTIIIDGVAVVSNWSMEQLTHFVESAYMVPIRIPFNRSLKIRYNHALEKAATLTFGGILYTP